MKKTNISTLKRDLSRYLDYVRRGGTVRVFDRDNPVADILPTGSSEPLSNEALQSTVDRLERQGALIRRGSGRVPASVLRRRPARINGSAVAAIADERREGR